MYKILSKKFLKIIKRTDWVILSSVLFLLFMGLSTMYSFSGGNAFFEKQIIWIIISFLIFFILSSFDFYFLRKTWSVVFLYSGIIFLLTLLFILGNTFQGAQSWFSLGFFSIQPSEIAKLVLIILLAKYFSRRHVEIAHIKHIFVSGVYSAILAFLVFIQPDFGSALIIFLIWVGMILVSGVSKKHLAMLVFMGIIVFAGLWSFAFEDYQKERIVSFLHPLTNLQGTGYNTYQSKIAVGSGGLLGKGVGYGTQSRLKFLPEYETDFIFAAYAEEWGLVGVLMFFVAFLILIYRILYYAKLGDTNFEILFALGVAIFFGSHFLIHIGVNLGMLPVTGTTLPFVSYGGSHLVVEFASLGILTAMGSYKRSAHKDDTKKEFLGV